MSEEIKEKIDKSKENHRYNITSSREWFENLLDYITNLQQENKQLKDLYRKTCDHLFNIGNDELARYFQAQINECSTFTTQILGEKE